MSDSPLNIAVAPAEVKGEHTPGPWTYAVKNNHRETGSVHYDIEAPASAKYPKGRLIAWLAGGLAEAMHDKDERLKLLRDPEIEADARLIAAAPEMLEALRAVVEWNRRIGGFCEPEDERDVLGPVLAAIAKAEGRP
jgi:hypothetical protein